MKRISLLFTALLAVAACSPVDGGATTTAPGVTTTTADEARVTTFGPTTTTGDPGFPVTVEADNGAVTIPDLPEAIVSLSATATEMLFSVGAGGQVVAVDDQSNFPVEAPTTDLSGYTPNVEAILSYEPDLVVIALNSGDIVAGLTAAGVPVLSYGPASTLGDTYRQLEAIGEATGHAGEAVALGEEIRSGLDEIVRGVPEIPEGTDYYHEVDNTFYSATSTTFIGQVYSLFGLDNIADPADEDDSAFGFPQLSNEYIVAADPDLIFLANALYGESAETVAARPGWDVLSAVGDGHIVELDSDVVSRWGPRVVDFARSIAEALDAYVSG